MSSWLLIRAESKVFKLDTMVLRSVRVEVADPRAVACRKSPDYPFKHTVTIELIFLGKYVPKLPK